MGGWRLTDDEFWEHDIVRIFPHPSDIVVGTGADGRHDRLGDSYFPGIAGRNGGGRNGEENRGIGRANLGGLGGRVSRTDLELLDRGELHSIFSRETV